ncbi:MAG: hypothetical protein MRJ96_13030 [Nitrospirales bacterium]|nr:glycosyltransferase family 9 protein [Nitrospira sp.]MDR4502367.1 hypothetical protein [Nitrospirales bacterium]
MLNRLVIQLARLGDLVQTLPAVVALQAAYTEDQFDLLCAAPLVSVGKSFPGVKQVLPWDGTEWEQMAQKVSSETDTALSQAAAYLERYQNSAYALAYNLNNHSRAILTAHLLAAKVNGPGCYGPLSSELPNWSRYLNLVGAHRGRNRVHLADAFCGLCGVKPPRTVPMLCLSAANHVERLDGFMAQDALRVAVIIGSGDPERRLPLRTWEEWITTFFSASARGRVVLVGGPGERELARALLDLVPPLYIGRIWDVCGQTTIPQLAELFSRCAWVVGSDTGPLHLAVASGARVQGFYFSRARVHETGPYGKGHWVWQAERTPPRHTLCDMPNMGEPGVWPEYWPVRESVELMLTERCAKLPAGWSLWRSQKDDWGAHFFGYAASSQEPSAYRQQIWDMLHEQENVDWDGVSALLHDATRVSVPSGEL